ncbi:MAG: NYN domain-containing protein [Pseudomonadota bacterium]|uniref:NYN domain-containing protein n=1 Tax=Qipengyuania flava TaxID=192812 RepID=UPI00273E5FDD|nr:NYN domain-containing protein [Qipengyuania flava]MEC7743595.1 NYN domain-containing protein [Pseudomonadota bacterium]
MSDKEDNPVAVGFIDGQNLFMQAKRLFGYHTPNFDPLALHREMCKVAGFLPGAVRFYTGMPSARRQPRWYAFWCNKTQAMERIGVDVTTRPLRYRKRRIFDEDGDVEFMVQAEEKGIDIRIALDLVRMARRDELTAAIIYSQDQDLNEVVSEIEAIGGLKGIEIKLACAFPTSPQSDFDRGVMNTQWLRFDKQLYDRCIDDRDYFPRT